MASDFGPVCVSAPGPFVVRQADFVRQRWRISVRPAAEGPGDCGGATPRRMGRKTFPPSHL